LHIYVLLYGSKIWRLILTENRGRAGRLEIKVLRKIFELKERGRKSRLEKSRYEKLHNL
jgi:hypothetical protein